MTRKQRSRPLHTSQDPRGSPRGLQDNSSPAASPGARGQALPSFDMDQDDDGPRVITELTGASWARTWWQLLFSLVLYAILIVLVKVKEKVMPRKKPSKAHPETFAVDEAYKHFIAVWVGDDDTGDLPQ